MRKGMGLAVAAGLVAVAMGLGIVLSRKQEPPEPSGPERVARDARASTGVLLPAPSPLPGGSLRITGVVLGDSGPLGGVRISATRPQAGQTLSELSCGEVLQRPDWNEKLPKCLNEAAGAVLEFVLAREGEAPVHAEASTADDGTFTLDGLPSGTFALWVADSRGAGMWPDVAAGTEGLALALGEGVTLEGRVSSEDGAPLAGARVTAVHTEHTRFFDTETGADGRYRLGPLPLASYRPAVSKEGWVPELGAGVEHEQVVLGRPRRLAGRVLSDGQPAPGVQVRAARQPDTEDAGDERRGSHPEHVATTDAAGRFTFDALWPASAYLLTATVGERHALARVERDESPLELVLELGTALRVEGTVRDVAGHPVAGARVTGNPHAAVTDAGGHYQLGPMEPGGFQLRVAASGYHRDFQRVKSGPGTLRVDFTLTSTVPVEGVVVDDAGKPVSGASLQLRGLEDLGETEADFYTVDVGQTDAEGRFHLGAPSPGDFELEVSVEGERIRAYHSLTAPATGVRVVMPRKARVSGTLTDERGTPFPGARVKLWQEDGAPGTDEAPRRAECETTTDVKGRFSLWGLEPGRFVLEATHDSGGVQRSTSRPVELQAQEALEVDLRLEAGWTLTGLAVDEAGQPLPGVQVHPVLPEQAEPAWRRGLYLGGPPLHAVTGADGRFTLRHLQTEELWLQVLAEAHVLVPSRSEGGQPSLQRFHVQRGAPEVRLVLERLVRIHGRLTGPDGAPITRFTLNGREVADPRGVFSRPIHTSGTWRMELSAKGMAPVLREVELHEGTDVDLGEIRMSPGRRVSGRVVDAETSLPVEWAQVLATRSRLAAVRLEDHQGSVRTDEDGAFTLPFVEPGPLVLFVEANDYRTGRLDLGTGDTDALLVRLDKGASVELSIQNPQGKPMAATVYVDRRGEPLPMRPFEVFGGSGVVSGLEPGSYRVHAFAPGRRRGSTVFAPQDVQVPASGQVKVDLRARSTGATLVLHVEESVGFSILFPGVAPPPRLFRDFVPVEARAFPYEGVLPASVTYRNLPPGRATLFLVERSLQGYHREELDLPAEGTVVREVTPGWTPFVFAGP